MKTDVVVFYGNKIPCTLVENQIKVGIKPICENIGLDFRNQCDLIKNDEVLSELWGVHHIVASDGKTREMYCLPLEFISGWLFQIKFTNTMSEGTKQKLITYKKDCYKILHNHFFGNVKKQIEVNEMEIKLLEEINEMNETKNKLTGELREKKTKLQKIREARLINEPSLFE
jgi:P22_AR N-terminal domain.